MFVVFRREVRTVSESCSISLAPVNERGSRAPSTQTRWPPKAHARPPAGDMGLGLRARMATRQGVVSESTHV